MLHKETVTKGTLDLINRLMADDYLKSFYLVGGTALSLLIGHRISIDIDLFTNRGFNAEKASRYLQKHYQTDLNNISENSVSGFIENIKFDLIAHRYPHVKPLLTIEGIRMLSIYDIAAMKVNAIVGNGTRVKDFLDVYYLLKEMSFHELLDAYLKKYPDVNHTIAKASLCYYNDIDFTVSVTMIKEELKWTDVERSIKKSIRLYEKEKRSSPGDIVN
jgi:hypothetical protein